MEDALIEKAIQYVTGLFQGNAGGHDLDHTLRVLKNTMEIAAEEPDCDSRLAALAALLHDADDHKLFKTENNANARAFLRENSVSPADTERIIAAVNAVSFSQNRGHRPETAEGRVVQDADRLDAMGAVGIARTFAYGGERGRPMEESIQHFYDKLLLLHGMMNTEAARKLAEKRHAFLETFLREYLDETGK